MSDFDIDLRGLDELKTDLEVLEEDGTSERVYTVGSSAEYAVYLEFGTENMPPYSWFRPAIREFEASPIKFIVENTGYSGLDDLDTADELVEAVAFALVNQMENNVSAMSSSDRSPGVDPDHPKVDTGNLKASISATRMR